MFDPFTSRNLTKSLGYFVGTGARNQKRYVFPDDLVCRVPVDVLGSIVPTGDSAVQVFAKDRVLGGINNRDQPGPVFSELLGGPSMQFFICATQCFCDSLAIADVTDRAQHE